MLTKGLLRISSKQRGRLLSGLFLFLLHSHALSSEFSFLLGQEHWRYIEVDNNEELDREVGWLNQVGVAGLIKITPSIYANTEIKRSTNALKYKGQTQSGAPHNTLTDTRTSSYIITGRYYFKGAPHRGSTAMYMGAGMQHQKWSREIRSAQGVSHLHEYYHWIGPRIETGFLTSPHPKIGLAVNTAASWLTGNMEVDLTTTPNVKHNFGSPTLKLKNGYELNSSLHFNWQLTPSTQLLTSYHVGYRHFPTSDKITASNGFSQITLFEPESSNHFHGVNIGIGYKFL